MDFELSDEQATLREVSRGMLADHSAPDRVRAVADSGRDVDPALWHLGTELGWIGLAVAEEHGGSGQGLVELCLVAEEVGRAVTPGPFLTTALVGLALARFGSAALRGECLPPLAEGQRSATWAAAERGGDWETTSPRTPAHRDGGTLLVRGHKTLVQDAGSAHWLLVTAALDGEPTLLLVDAAADGVTTRRQQVMDKTRSFYEVGLDGVRVPYERVLGGGGEAVGWLCAVAAVLTSADALGAADRLLEMTVEYVKARHQFDRAIGSFQAVKHKCSTMLSLTRGARAATYYAAMALDAEADDARRAATVAKSFTSERMSTVAGEALQLHGGIGFTWEHDLHLYLRRTKTDEVLYGDTTAHQERLSTTLAADHAATR